MAKSKSRAARAGDAASHLNEIANELREAKTYDEARAALDKLDTSEIESLSEEITSWRDNIEEKFSATEKFSILDESSGQLEFIVDALQSLDDLSEPEPIEAAKPAAAPGEVINSPEPAKQGDTDEDEDEDADDGDDESAQWKQDAGSIADELENQASELEGVEFPGMF